MKQDLTDINHKPSTTRKILNKYTKYILLFNAFVILLSIILNRDVGENISFVIVSINGIFFGTSYAKMGMEFFCKRK